MPITVLSDSLAQFTVPLDVVAGPAALALYSSSIRLSQFVIWFDDPSAELPLYLGDASDICIGTKFMDRNGDEQEGSKDCGTGSVPECAADGATSCIATDAYAAAATAGLASKVLSGQTVAGVSGNVTLPAVGLVLTGTDYGVGGDGLSGRLTLPAAGDVLSGSGTYGDPGAAVTPTLANRGSWDLTTAFPGTGYYTGVSNAPTAYLLSSAQIAGSSGSIGNCASANSQGCFATGSYYASTLCASDGGTSCVVDNGTNFRAAGAGVLLAGNIRSGVTIGGQLGTLAEAPSDCAADGATGCVAVAGFPAARVHADHLHERNIKSGVTIAGVSGQYPSATYTLPGASVTPDLTNFITQLTTDGAFEFWDSAGVRRTGSGDSDIIASNVLLGVEFENLNITGEAAGGGASDCTDAGQVGCLTTSFYRSTKPFRNTARTALYDNVTNPASAGLDIWDTIEYLNDDVAGLPSGQPWGATHAANATYWEDLTDGGCDSADDECVFQDKITGLMWSEQSENLDFSDVAGGDWPCGSSSCTQTLGNVTSGGGSGAYASGAPMRWWDAIYACNLLNARNFGGFDSGWRLPTQKEMMQANIHGIRSVKSTYWISASSRWSASTQSTNRIAAWRVNLGQGWVSSELKTVANNFVCVR